MRSYGKQTRSEQTGGDAVPVRTGVPGKQTLTSGLPGIQLKSSGDAPHGEATPADSFAHATSGAGSELPYRSRLERAFGTSLGGVSAHLGGSEAQQGLSGLGARAAAHGNSIAFAESAPSLGLVAHETAHVIQQRAAGGGSVQRKPSGVSTPGNDAESRADAAADAVVAGLSVPDVGTAPTDDIHRDVDTSGGRWSTPTYTARAAGTGAVGDRVGCSIELHFTPNDLVQAPLNGIGITQSVKSMKSTTHGGARDAFAPPADPGKAMVTLGAGSTDPGRGIDRNIYPSDPAGPAGARAIPNTNPMYGVYNPGAGAAGVSTNLTDNTPSVGATQFGSHVRKPDGTFEAPVDAVLDDTPNRRLESAGQTYEQTFEATALVLSGPLANTYLGSVAWGYASTEAGVSNLTPPAVTVVSYGTPSAQFTEAATQWNNAQLPDRGDPTAPLIDTVNLPITTHATVDPATLDDRQLIERIRELTDRLMTMDRTSVDYQQVRFESRSLAAEAVRRGVSAADSGHTLTVARGDSLWNLAQHHLGAGARWTQIFALNRVDILDPNRIAAGQVLKMPVPYTPAGGGGGG
jgi:nucleoid-associated protein YgaU